MNNQLIFPVLNDGFRLIGMACRTTNEQEMSSGGKIGPLWEKFYIEQAGENIPAQISQDIMACYTDYESDEHGTYTYIIGKKVAPGTVAPPGMLAIDIPKQNYAIFTTEKGMIPDVVIKTWMQIWNLRGSDKLGGKRAYSFDFEIYDHRAVDPSGSEVDIWISV